MCVCVGVGVGVCTCVHVCYFVIYNIMWTVCACIYDCTYYLCVFGVVGTHVNLTWSWLKTFAPLFQVCSCVYVYMQWNLPKKCPF